MSVAKGSLFSGRLLLSHSLAIILLTVSGSASPINLRSTTYKLVIIPGQLTILISTDYDQNELVLVTPSLPTGYPHSVEHPASSHCIERHLLLLRERGWQVSYTFARGQAGQKGKLIFYYTGAYGLPLATIIYQLPADLLADGPHLLEVVYTNESLLAASASPVIFDPLQESILEHNLQLLQGHGTEEHSLAIQTSSVSLNIRRPNDHTLYLEHNPQGFLHYHFGTCSLCVEDTVHIDDGQASPVAGIQHPIQVQCTFQPQVLMASVYLLLWLSQSKSWFQQQLLQAARYVPGPNETFIILWMAVYLTLAVSQAK